MGKIIKKLKHPAKLHKPEISKKFKGDKIIKAKDKTSKKIKKKLKENFVVDGKEAKLLEENLGKTGEDGFKVKTKTKKSKEKLKENFAIHEKEAKLLKEIPGKTDENGSEVKTKTKKGKKTLEENFAIDEKEAKLLEEIPGKIAEDGSEVKIKRKKNKEKLKQNFASDGNEAKLLDEILGKIDEDGSEVKTKTKKRKKTLKENFTSDGKEVKLLEEIPGKTDEDESEVKIKRKKNKGKLKENLAIDEKETKLLKEIPEKTDEDGSEVKTKTKKSKKKLKENFASDGKEAKLLEINGKIDQNGSEVKIKTKKNKKTLKENFAIDKKEAKLLEENLPKTDENGSIKKFVRTNEIDDVAMNDNANSADVQSKENNSATSPNKQEDSEKKLRYESKPQNTIFIGNLAPSTKKTQLKTMFLPFGNVVSVRFRTAEGKKLFKHATRKKAESLNGYVVFDNEESKRKALSMSGSEFKGRHIRVTAVKDYTTDVSTKTLVYVGNLKYSATDEKLYEIFSSCGELDYVRTVRHEKGCTGSAFVCFKKPESVTLALELNNSMLDDRPIRVQRYKKNDRPRENQKVLSGPARRLAEKKKHMKGGKHADRAKNSSEMKLKKEKKSDFHGKKISTMKKKPKNKKKFTHLQKLAKRIAPK